MFRTLLSWHLTSAKPTVEYNETLHEARGTLVELHGQIWSFRKQQQNLMVGQQTLQIQRSDRQVKSTQTVIVVGEN